ncbi:MAG: hypothetical protein ACLFM2_03010 [Halothece sp.]
MAIARLPDGFSSKYGASNLINVEIIAESKNTLRINATSIE